METLRRLLTQMREYWAGLSLGRRILVGGAAAALAIAIGTVAYLSGSTYVPVYRDLALEEAAAMRTSLQGLNIPVQLSADGTAVLVPQERAAEAKVALAGAGLPTRGGKGFETFEETSLLTTPFAQSVNYQRALQAELSRSIGQLESVQSARVLIAKPEPSPFIRDQKQPTASVILKLKPGAVMSRTSAASVVSLVARSVEGLKPENVTVVDSGGRLLSDPHAADRDSLPTPHLEYRRELEAYLAEKAEKMLAHHLGPGRAVVQVSADINFQRLKETSHTFGPGTPKSELTQTEKSSGGGPRGTAGARSNVPAAGGGAPLNSGSGGGSTSSSETIRVDHAPSETIRSVEDGLGAVTRLSIAALVDLNPQGEGQTVISATDASELIQKAIGFKTGRDEVKVTNAKLTGPIGPAEPDETLSKLQRFQAYVGLARNISLALAAFLVVLIVALLALRRRVVPEPAPIPPAAPTADEQRRAELERLIEMARTDPDRVAAVFRAMVGA